MVAFEVAAVQIAVSGWGTYQGWKEALDQIIPDGEPSVFLETPALVGYEFEPFMFDDMEKELNEYADKITDDSLKIVTEKFREAIARGRKYNASIKFS